MPVNSWFWELKYEGNPLHTELLLLIKDIKSDLWHLVLSSEAELAECREDLSLAVLNGSLAGESFFKIFIVHHAVQGFRDTLGKGTRDGEALCIVAYDELEWR